MSDTVIETHQKKIVPIVSNEFNPTDSYIQKSISLVDNYIGHNNWRIKENSNSSYSVQGLYDHLVQYSNSLYWLYNIYDKDIRETHIRGDFHIHDLGYFTAYCMGWDLEMLLIKGFGGVSGKVKSRPPKHFAACLGQIWNFFYTMQGESAGAQAFSSFDTYLAPFVKKDNLKYEEVKQLMEEFIYNMNVPTRAGFQTPFTNITLDLQCPNILKDKNIIIGGEIQEETYGMFQNEMNMINKAFCEIMMSGDASQRIFTFPIPTYNITEDFNWDNPELKPLWEMTAKFGIPYFANFCGSDMSPDDARSMCLKYETALNVKKKNTNTTTRMAIGELVERSICSHGKIKFHQEYLVKTSQGFKPIKSVIKTTSDSFVEFVTLDGWKLRTTDNHPHIVYNDKDEQVVVIAKDLKEGMKVLVNKMASNEQFYSTIDRIEYIKSSRKINVYDIEIDDENVHDFFADNILTHNCCRLRIDNRELRKRGGGLFGSNPMTGSVGVVTINMPRIGYLSKTKKEIFERLESLMDLAAKSLLRKREIIEKNTDDGLYPYIKIYLSDIKKRLGSYLANHFNTIGLVGMNEFCLNYMNKDITTPQGLELSKEVLNFMRNKMLQYQEKYNTPFNLEATPAEGTCVVKDTCVLTTKGNLTVEEILNLTQEEKDELGILSWNETDNILEVKHLKNIWQTKTNAQVMKITFDNEDSIIITPNHKIAQRYIIGRGSSRQAGFNWVESGTLKVNDRLVAVNIHENDKRYYNYYDITIGAKGGKFDQHILFSEWYYGHKKPEGYVVHHKNRNPYDNSKENLEFLSEHDHKVEHGKTESYKHLKIGSGQDNPFYGKHHTNETKEVLKKWKKEHYDEWYEKMNSACTSEEFRKKMSEIAKSKPIEKHSRYKHNVSNEKIIELWKQGKTFKQISEELGGDYTYNMVRGRLHQCGLIPNHKVVSIEYLTEGQDVYDLEIEDNHNFFICGSKTMDSGVLVHNCYKLGKLDVERYKNIITAGTKEAPYYTNSSQINVKSAGDLFNDLSHQNELQPLYTGGTVLHMYMGEKIDDYESVKIILKKICNNFKIPYVSFTPTFSICPKCGYIAGEHETCPNCIEVNEE